MAGSGDVFGRIIDAVMSRSTSLRDYRARTGGGGDIGLTMKPNAPRMITVVIAIVLCAAGLSYFFEITWVIERLDDAGIQLTKDQASWLLVGGPALVVAGSLFRGL